MPARRLARRARLVAQDFSLRAALQGGIGPVFVSAAGGPYFSIPGKRSREKACNPEAN
jgi:hypothetical protein